MDTGREDLPTSLSGVAVTQSGRDGGPVRGLGAVHLVHGNPKAELGRPVPGARHDQTMQLFLI